MAPSLLTLRDSLAPQQARVLSTIWSHRLSTGNWIPTRLLHTLHGTKAQVRPLLDALGGSIVYRTDETGQQKYGLTLLGALLSADGPRLEALLVRFLTAAREKALHEPLRTHIQSEEIARSLDLTATEVAELGALLYLGPFSPSGSYAKDGWNVVLPPDIEDIPSDPSQYVAQAAIAGYDPGEPVDPQARRAHLAALRTAQGSPFARPPITLPTERPKEDSMAARITDRLLLAIADDIDRRLTRRSFERLLVDEGLYSLAVLTEEMGEYSGLSKRELVRTVLMELASGFNSAPLLRALSRHKVLSRQNLDAIVTAGLLAGPLPEEAEPMPESRSPRPSRKRPRSKQKGPRPSTRRKSSLNRRQRWDVFVSHASEDKADIARPLAARLRKEGLSVWYDEFALRLGDSLASSIDKGLASSRYGIVIISKSFLAKEWPRKELDALVTRERRGHKVILPVWHNITAAQVRRRSPLLASKVAISSSKGLDRVIASVLEVVRPRR
jgi:hypothetical protein